MPQLICFYILSANHKTSCLLCPLLKCLDTFWSNRVDLDQTALKGTVWSGSTLFAYLSTLHTQAKSMKSALRPVKFFQIR